MKLKLFDGYKVKLFSYICKRIFVINYKKVIFVV